MREADRRAFPRGGLRRVDAVVLKARAFSETSLVGYLMTRQLGRIGVICRGARRPGRLASAALQPTNVITCSVYVHERSGLRTVSNVESLVVHEAIPKDPRVFGLAGYALELVVSQLPEEEPAPRVYDLLRGLLDALNREGPHRANELMLAFELRLQRERGWGLSLDACVRCGRPVADSPALSLRAGGVLCTMHARDACESTVTRGDLQALRVVLATPDHQWGPWGASAETVDRLAGIIRAVWDLHGPVPMKSSALAFLAEFKGAPYGEQSRRVHPGDHRPPEDRRPLVPPVADTRGSQGGT